MPLPGEPGKLASNTTEMPREEKEGIDLSIGLLDSEVYA